MHQRPDQGGLLRDGILPEGLAHRAAVRIRMSHQLVPGTKDGDRLGRQRLVIGWSAASSYRAFDRRRAPLREQFFPSVQRAVGTNPLPAESAAVLTLSSLQCHIGRHEQDQNRLCLLRLRRRHQSPLSSKPPSRSERNSPRTASALVYGGGSIGLMGAVATADAGSRRHRHRHHSRASSPRKERMLTRVQDLIVTDDMHERKRLMFERSDAFVALPGGIGTLEELVEQTDLAAARPPHQADPARQHRRLLGTAAGAAGAYARHRFIRPSLQSTFSRPNASRTSCRGCAPPPPRAGRSG